MTQPRLARPAAVEGMFQICRLLPPMPACTADRSPGASAGGEPLLLDYKEHHTDTTVRAPRHAAPLCWKGRGAASGGRPPRPAPLAARRLEPCAPTGCQPAARQPCVPPGTPDIRHSLCSIVQSHLTQPILSQAVPLTPAPSRLPVSPKGALFV
jgi:hypothetical protein